MPCQEYTEFQVGQWEKPPSMAFASADEQSARCAAARSDWCL